MVRLLGVRNTSAAVGLGLLAAGLGVLGAGSSGPAAIRYELNAPLGVTGGRVFACFSYALMVDVSQVPDGGGDHGLPWSQPMRLVGTWDGRALTLTEAPQVAQAAPGLPEPCTQDFSPQPGFDSMQRQIEVIDALRTRGIDVLMSTGCDGNAVGIVVPVADDATVNWLTRHYSVKIVGWLRRLPSGP
ncbi:MAG: hypothetical protein E6J07_04620 [Chloroflexi bacterium]|nr:MAG: hypothetical protein E6J07_04620 [Chloroflexota bacterium]